MPKFAVFIDGFNVYHALNDEKAYHKYKWLNYWKLAERFVDPTDVIIKVLFFTALPLLRKDDPIKRRESREKRARHELYEKALVSTGTRIIHGRYKRRNRYCPRGHSYQGSEEKMTDVNIAVSLLEEGITGESDKCIVFSGDNDLVPAVRMFLKLCPKKEVHIVRPIGLRGQRAHALCKHAHKNHWMYVAHLRESQFENPIILRDGTRLERPTNWQ